MKKILKNKHHAAEIGAGAVAAAALAMAGGYVLWERMGKEKQAKVKRWVAEARKETAKKVAHAKKLSEGEYKRIVDSVVKQYGSLDDVNKAELQKTATMLKSEWKRIQGHARTLAKRMPIKRPTRKAIKTKPRGGSKKK
jgi:hypothetical protein